MRSIRFLVFGFLFFFFQELLFSQMSYSPDISLRNNIRKQLWQELKPLTPQKNRFLMGLVFNSNEPFKTYESIANKQNWAPYEIPTVFTFFQIICTEVSEGKIYTEAEYKPIYESIYKEMSKAQIDGNLNNIQLQKKYDVLVLKAFWIVSLFEMNKRNSPQIQELAEQQLKANSLIAKMTNTNKDIVIAPVNKKSKSIVEQTKPITNANTHKGYGVSQVEEVILRTVTSYGLGGVYVTNKVYVLYKNGDIYTSPTKPLESMDISQSKRNNPSKWDKWQKKDGILFVTRSKTGKTYDWKKYFKLRKGTKGFKLSGKFNTSDSFVGANMVNASTVFFDDQGRFAWKTIKGGVTAWKPIYSKSTSSGTYSINDYTLTLQYNNGKTESYFFGLYPKDNQHFVIGSSHFTPVN